MLNKKIKILKGRGKTFSLYVQDESGNPRSIEGWSLIRVSIKHATGCLKMYAPRTAGQDEIQELDLKAPTAGTYVLAFGDETTTELAFDATAQQIQDALNALNELSGVVVAALEEGISHQSNVGSPGYLDAHPWISGGLPIRR